MSKATPSFDTAGLKESNSYFFIVEIEETRNFSASENALHGAEALMELSTLERGRSNIVADNGLREPLTIPIGVSTVTYKLYKRRWIGLIQLVLLNMLFGWNV
jgi:hypothetical protein